MEIIRNGKEATIEEKKEYAEYLKNLYKDILARAVDKIDLVFDQLSLDTIYNLGIQDVADACNQCIKEYTDGYIEGMRIDFKERQMKNLKDVTSNQNEDKDAVEKFFVEDVTNEISKAKCPLYLSINELNFIALQVLEKYPNVNVNKVTVEKVPNSSDDIFRFNMNKLN